MFMDSFELDGRIGLAQLRTAQLGPTFTSTFSGTRSSMHALHFFADQRRRVVDVARAATSNTSSSWICSSILRRQAFVAQPAVDRDHRELDQVGRGALDHGVDGRALGQVELPAAAGLGSRKPGGTGRTPWIARRRPRIVDT